MNKPSERITELWAIRKNTTPLAFPIDDLNPILRAMFDYLDEEHAKKHQHAEGIKCNEC